VEQAVDDVIAEGARTPDIARGAASISTREMAETIMSAVRTLHKGQR
jgi:hypothetical protein